MRRSRANRPATAGLLALATVLAAPALADMTIELKSGEIIRVPVDPDQVEAITFDPVPGKSVPQVEIRRPAAKLSPAARAAAQLAKRYRVGPSERWKTPGELQDIARDGDVIEIAAGLYVDDFATWTQNRLVLRGVGGRARLVARGPIPNGKAIWVIGGDEVLVENMEFSGARVPDHNGAGIRHEGGRLTIRDSYFHANEMAILAGTLPHAEITIEGSEFARHRRAGSFTHAVYIGRVARFTMRGSYLHHTAGGHHVKSRADITDLRFNRIDDEADGASSYLVDLPNCGFATLVGNLLHQGRRADNLAAIAYGAEGCEGRELSLAVVNNSFLNSARSGTFVQNYTNTRVRLINNIHAGPGKLVTGPAEVANNLRAEPAIYRDAVMMDLRPVSGSAAIDAGMDPGEALRPGRHYIHPLSSAMRPWDGQVDIGAYEFTAE